MDYCCLPPERVQLTVKSKRETNGRVKIGQESKLNKGQNGPRVKMGCCCLPPERVELTVNNKKKQMTGSEWAKSQNGLLLFERVELTVNSKRETNGRVKMDQESKWATDV